jgi:Mrp family chromosome partitioning ATPase/capsular polysaccharide biosynthesis protein
VADAAPDQSTAQYYTRLFLRRKWIVLAFLVLTPTLAVLYSLRQPSLYAASAKVWLKQGNLAATLSGIQDTSVYFDPDRLAQTQAEIAQTRVVAGRVLRRTHITDRTPAGLLGSLSITAESAADILVFAVTDRDPRLAGRLANEFAHQYTVLRRQLDTAALNQALRQVLQRLDALKGAKARGSAGYIRSLNDTADQLRTFLALEGANAVVARPAEGAGKVQPRPKRYAALGLGLGVMLGIMAAFLWDALDTRVRSAEEIAQRLGIPLLARVHEPPSHLQRANLLAMLEEPTGIEAEAFRVLRTNLEFVNLEPGARTIMIVSALAQEGKSTTVANLAVAAARAGRRVALVDLDLRRPYLGRFFRLKSNMGLTNVALGQASLTEALARIAFAPPDGENGTGRGSNGHGPGGGFLDVLPSGPIPPDAGEFVATSAVAGILSQLRASHDLVFVDSPPLLHVGDALTLATEVDAIIVLTRLPVVRRPILRELKRVLDSCPGKKLGFALAGSHHQDDYGYGYDYEYQGYTPRQEESGRREEASSRRP